MIAWMALGLLFICIMAVYGLAVFFAPSAYLMGFPILYRLACICLALLLFSLLFKICWRVIPRDTQTAFRDRQFVLKLILGGCLFLALAGSATLYRMLATVPPVLKAGSIVCYLFSCLLLASCLIKKDIKRRILAAAAFLATAGAVFTSFPRGAVITGPSTIETLASLSYLTIAPLEGTEDKEGVIFHDPQKAYQGLNLYAPRHLSAAYLMDMDGSVIHSWSWGEGGWQEIEMDKNGDLLAYVKDQYMLRLSWDSRVKWVNKMRVHHDVTVAENGDIYALARVDLIGFLRCIPVPVLNDSIVVFNPDGEIKEIIPLFSILKPFLPVKRISAIHAWIMKPGSQKMFRSLRRAQGYLLPYDSPADLMHINNVEILPKDIPGIAHKGDLLISARNINLVAILDRETKRVVWSWGPGEIRLQHHASFLDNGHILIFDNRTSREGFSRIVELDPVTRTIVWQYKSDPPENFFSAFQGSCQRLPNGNTLITESHAGYIFEVTPAGDLVWGFYAPIVENGRAAVYRLKRITNPEEYPVLRRQN